MSWSQKKELNPLARKISTGISKKLTCFLLCSPRMHISKFSSNLPTITNYYFSSSTSQANSNIWGLRLGTTLCHPQECNYDEMVKPNGRNGLKWKQAESKTRQDVKKFIKHSLDQAKLPPCVEPILWNNVFCQKLKIPILNLILLMVQIR